MVRAQKKCSLREFVRIVFEILKKNNEFPPIPPSHNKLQHLNFELKYYSLALIP